jgi:hypothetical protein
MLHMQEKKFQPFSKQWVDKKQNNKDLYDYLHLIEQNVKQ